jgi:hypothetical protein
MSQYDAYVRADYTYTPHYTSIPFTPGSTTYSPDTNFVPKSEILNVRAGVTYGKFDFNLFVNNVTNSTPLLALFHENPASTYYRAGTFRPRTVGVTLVLRN